MGVSPVLVWAVLWSASLVAPILLSGTAARRIGQLTLPIAGLLALAAQPDASAGWKLLCSSLMFLYLMKGSVLLGQPLERLRMSGRWPYLLYFSLWPGMDSAWLSHT